MKKIISLILSVAMLWAIACNAFASANVTYYSLTGYNFDDEAKTYYNGLGITLADADAGASVNGGDSPLASLIIPDTTKLESNSAAVLFGGALGGTEKGYRVATWAGGFSREAYIDLKAVKGIDRIDIFADQYSEYQGGYITSIKIETADAMDSASWTQIAFTDEIKDAEADKVLEDNDQNHNVYHYAMPLSATANARYLKLTIAAVHCFELSHMSILGRSVPAAAENVDRDIKVLSANAVPNGGYYADKGYNLTYLDTGADYMWNASYLNATGTTGVSDEQTGFDTTIVASSDTAAGRPDMQDGGIGYGGSYACNTTGSWGSANAVSIIWDLKALRYVDRLDIVKTNGSTYDLTQVDVFGRKSSTDEWVSVASFPAPTSNAWNDSYNIDIYKLDGNIYRYVRVDMKSAYQVNLNEMYLFGDVAPELDSIMFTKDQVTAMTDSLVPGEGVTAAARIKNGVCDVTLEHIAQDGETVKRAWTKTGSEVTINLDPEYTKDMLSGETLRVDAAMTINGIKNSFGEAEIRIGEGSVSGAQSYSGSASSSAYFDENFDDGVIDAESITGGSEISLDDGLLSVPYNANGYILKLWEGFDAPVTNSRLTYSFRINSTSAAVPVRLKVADASGDTDGAHLLDVRTESGEAVPGFYLFGKNESSKTAESWNADGWNRIDVTVNQRTEVGEIWVNGSLVSVTSMPAENSAYKSIGKFGMIVYGADASGKENLVDDVSCRIAPENFEATVAYSDEDVIVDFTNMPDNTSFKLDNIYLYEVGGDLVEHTSSVSDGRIVIAPAGPLTEGREYKVILPEYLRSIYGSKIANDTILFGIGDDYLKLRIVDIAGNEVVPEKSPKSSFTALKLYFSTAPENVSVTYDGEALDVTGSEKEYSAELAAQAAGEKEHTIVVGWDGGEQSFTLTPVADYELEWLRVHNNAISDKVTVNARLTNNSLKDGLDYTAISAMYDASGSLVSVAGVNDNKTLPLGTSVKISQELERPEDYGDTYSIKMLLWDGIDTMKPLASGDAFAKGSAVITPAYEKTELNQLVEKYNARNIDGFNIGLITDVQPTATSGYSTWSHHYASLVKASELIELDAIMDLGDLTDGQYLDNEPMLSLMNEQASILNEANVPTFRVRGNHDDNRYVSAWGGMYETGKLLRVSPQKWLESSEVNWGATMDGSTAGKETYYYKDFPEDKIRIIALDTVDVPFTGGGDYDYGYSQKQLEWLVDEALDFSDKTDKKEWGVIFIGHTMTNEIYIGDHNWDSFAAVMKAFMEGTSGIISEPGGRSPVIDLEYDFTKQGAMEVICCLTGHVHYDNVTLYNGVLDIATTCSMGNNVKYSKGFEDATEDAWDIVTVDRKAGRIYFTRFGDIGTDRAFDYVNNKRLTLDENGNVVE